MEVKELRIGNLVYCKTENGNKVGKICALTDTMISADVLDEKDDNHYRNYVGIYRNYVGKFSDGEVDCVLPIEITDKMLLDNGFEFDKNKDIRSYSKGKICLYIKSFNDPQSAYGGTEYIMNITDNLYFNRFNSTRTKPFYVHELQNAYFMVTKQDLEFKI